MPIVQHATANCCRRCISKWHGIEKGSVIGKAEVEYVAALIMGLCKFNPILQRPCSGIWGRVLISDYRQPINH